MGGYQRRVHGVHHPLFLQFDADDGVPADGVLLRDFAQLLHRPWALLRRIGLRGVLQIRVPDIQQHQGRVNAARLPLPPFRLTAMWLALLLSACATDSLTPCGRLVWSVETVVRRTAVCASG